MAPGPGRRWLIDSSHGQVHCPRARSNGSFIQDLILVSSFYFLRSGEVKPSLISVIPLTLLLLNHRPLNYLTSISKAIVCPAHYFPAPPPGLLANHGIWHRWAYFFLWEPAADNTFEIENTPSFKPPTWVAQSAESRQMWVMLRIVR